MHVTTSGEAVRFARDWRRRHPRDRVTILSRALDPLAEFDGAYPERAQPGSTASGTLS